MNPQPQTHSRQTRIKEIRNFLIVIGAGLLSAALFAGVMIYYYTPSGQFKVNKVLLSPEVAEKLSTSNGTAARVVFDGIEFASFNAMNNTWDRVKVDMDSYKKFYKMIQNDKSIRNPSKEEIDRFTFEKPASLLLRVRGEEGDVLTFSSRIFQEVQFVQDDFYRIEMREFGEGERWSYFYHPKVYEQAQKIFYPEL